MLSALQRMQPELRTVDPMRISQPLKASGKAQSKACNFRVGPVKTNDCADQYTGSHEDTQFHVATARVIFDSEAQRRLFCRHEAHSRQEITGIDREWSSLGQAYSIQGIETLDDARNTVTSGLDRLACQRHTDRFQYQVFPK